MGDIFVHLKFFIMKPKFFLSHLIIAFTSFILIASCTKEAGPGPGNPGGTLNQEKIVDLLADHWVPQGSGLYVDPLLGVLQGRGSFNAYAETSNGAILLSSTPTAFMEGEIWTTISNANLIINYKSLKGSLPFSSIKIRIVFAN